MPNYDRSVGSAGTMRIEDYGTGVAFWVLCSDPATSSGSYSWSGIVNGQPVGGTTNLPAGFGSRNLGAWPVTTSQTVTFHQNATGTQGLGGAADHSAQIVRNTDPPPVPVAPGAPVPLGFENVTTTSMTYVWRYGTIGTHPISSRAVMYASSPDFSTGSSGWFAVDESGRVPVSGLTPGVEYFFKVRVQSAAGLSPESPVTSQRTLGGVYVSDGSSWQPTELVVSDGSSWKAATVEVSDGTAWRPTA